MVVLHVHVHVYIRMTTSIRTEYMDVVYTNYNFTYTGSNFSLNNTKHNFRDYKITISQITAASSG